MNLTRRQLVCRLAAFPSVASYCAGTNAHVSPASLHVVEIKHFKFSALQVNIKPGDTIRWVNKDIVPHTATAIDFSWDTGEIKAGETAEVTVGPDFQRSYYCVYHPMMTTRIGG